MAVKSQFPLTGFWAYLQDRGLSDATCVMYAARVRSALRQATRGELPTAEQVAQALLLTDGPQRSVFRTAWKHYRTFLHSQGYKDVSALTAATVGTPWLEPVRGALHRLLGAMNPQLTPAELFYLNFGRISMVEAGVVFQATSRPFAANQPPPKLLPADRLEPYYAILTWGYSGLDGPPDEDAPFLPAGPGADIPMELHIIKRLCKGAPKPAAKTYRPQAAPAPAPYRPADDAPTATGEPPPSSLFGARTVPGEPPKD